MKFVIGAELGESTLILFSEFNVGVYRSIIAPVLHETQIEIYQLSIEIYLM
jgi:hypothetical protein